MQTQCNQHVECAFVLLLAITSCYSKIEIKIKAISSNVNPVITYSGAVDKYLTEKDLNLFNITDYNLKQGIKVELGKVPNDVFLKDPTPYYDMYKKYKWVEVKRRVGVKRAQVYEIVYQNVTLSAHNVINNTTRRVKTKIGLTEPVESTIFSLWPDKQIPNDDIFYNISVTCGNQSFIFKNRWKGNNFQSVMLPFGISNIGYISLDPGQAAKIELTAVKTILIMKVDYYSALIGNVVANYTKRFGKHHFWAPIVGDIMKAAKLKNEILTSEFIELRYYVDPRVKIVDKYTHHQPPLPFHDKRQPS